MKGFALTAAMRFGQSQILTQHPEEQSMPADLRGRLRGSVAEFDPAGLGSVENLSY